MRKHCTTFNCVSHRSRSSQKLLFRIIVKYLYALCVRKLLIEMVIQFSYGWNFWPDIWIGLHGPFWDMTIAFELEDHHNLIRREILSNHGGLTFYSKSFRVLFLAPIAFMCHFGTRTSSVGLKATTNHQSLYDSQLDFSTCITYVSSS